MTRFKQALTKFVEAGYDPSDTTEARLKKTALTLVPLIIGTAAFVWGGIYFLLGYSLPGSIPMSYSIISLFSLVYYFRTGRTDFLQYSQLILVLILPFLLMWSLGGFFYGSTVMIWALFAPVAASMFLKQNHAFLWFVAYLLLLLFSALINNILEQNITPIPQLAQNIFFVLNLGGGSAGLYLLIKYTHDQQTNAVSLLTDAMQELESASRAKSEFLASMSHELRTPLHGILSFSSFGIEKLDHVANDKIKMYFSRIQQSGNRLKVLLDDLLDLSKLEAGKMEMHIKPTSIQLLVNDCIAEQEASLKQKNITVEYKYPPDIPDIHCDANRISQVIMNILNNAIKFSPDNGIISFVCSHDLIIHDDEHCPAVKLSILDQGHGVSDDEVESIFDKFVQSKKNLSIHGGTGLGLAISKEIIQIHHGKIWCSRPVQDRGAEFNILLPV